VTPIDSHHFRLTDDLSTNRDVILIHQVPRALISPDFVTSSSFPTFFLHSSTTPRPPALAQCDFQRCLCPADRRDVVETVGLTARFPGKHDNEELVGGGEYRQRVVADDGEAGRALHKIVSQRRL
jgi:hypothetical protein